MNATSPSAVQPNAEQRAPLLVPEHHFVKHTPLRPPFPERMETAIFSLGCFWGAEKRYWELEGVYTTAVGFAGGNLEHPTYREVCNGGTGHAEAVLVVYDPQVVSYEQLLNVFWNSHNPVRSTKFDQDLSSQYRSVIFSTSSAQSELAKRSLLHHQDKISIDKDVCINTQISPAPQFYYADAKHQQYIAKRSNKW